MTARKAAKVKTTDAKTSDSFQNFAAKAGWGANQLFSGSTYGFHPISRERTLLEWMYRGSWVVGVAVDSVAEDMTRGGIEINSTLKPDKIEELQAAFQELCMWSCFCDGAKWGRLYGGAIVVAQIDGQDPETPFRPETIGKNAFKGFVVYDRWMLDPSLNELVDEPGPDIGLPKFYKVTASAATSTGYPAHYGKKIHHSRVARFTGVSLPWQQAMQENLWGLSVIERLFDRLVAFDSATTGAAQLVYKAYLRTYKIPKLREIIAAGGKKLEGLMKQLGMIRDFQANENLTIIDAEDDFEFSTYTFAGLDNVLMGLGQQLSGALQIPLVRLFGQAPAGLNSTGDSDWKNYYDGILQKQEHVLRAPLSRFVPAIAKSKGIELPKGCGYSFRSLWQLKDDERITAAGTIANAVKSVFDSGIIGRGAALKELRQTSRITGVFSNITDEEIKEAEEEPPKPSEMEEQAEAESEKEERAKVGDELAIVPGIDVVLETLRGMPRQGGVLAADYGYIRGVMGADGDPLDCFVGPDPNSPTVFVLDTLVPETGAFDEHKVMFGYGSRVAALKDFSRSYHDAGVGRVGAVAKMSMLEFKDWLKKPKLRVA